MGLSFPRCCACVSMFGIYMCQLFDNVVDRDAPDTPSHRRAYLLPLSISLVSLSPVLPLCDLVLPLLLSLSILCPRCYPLLGLSSALVTE